MGRLKNYCAPVQYGDGRYASYGRCNLTNWTNASSCKCSKADAKDPEECHWNSGSHCSNRDALDEKLALIALEEL